jgi:hypothetical protein
MCECFDNCVYDLYYVCLNVLCFVLFRVCVFYSYLFCL